MNIQDEARQEAERRWPALPPGSEELTYPRSAVRGMARGAFEAGAEWASEQADREPSEPVHVQIAARKAGKSSTLADMILERANAQGIRTEFVTPDREPSDAEVEAFREAWHRADAEWDGAGNRVRRGLIAAREVRSRG